jgi:hypothetical protein
VRERVVDQHQVEAAELSNEPARDLQTKRIVPGRHVCRSGDARIRFQPEHAQATLAERPQ